MNNGEKVILQRNDFGEFQFQLEQQTAIMQNDAIELGHCKDCKHYLADNITNIENGLTYTIYECEINKSDFGKFGFCSKFEKKQS